MLGLGADFPTGGSDTRPKKKKRPANRGRNKLGCYTVHFSEFSYVSATVILEGVRDCAISLRLPRLLPILLSELARIH
jgi:hypothetical protein